MTQISDIVAESSRYVAQLMKEHLTEDYRYHNIKHTQEVVSAAIEIGKNSGLSEDELEIVTLSAWFHDVGFTEGYDNHEERGVRIAHTFLKDRMYPTENLDRIESCIMATRLPQTAHTMLEMTLADADLSHLGRADFLETGTALREEWDKVLNRPYSDYDWLEINIIFISSHVYFTEYARKTFDKQRMKNVEQLLAMINALDF